MIPETSPISNFRILQHTKREVESAAANTKVPTHCLRQIVCPLSSGRTLSACEYRLVRTINVEKQFCIN